MSHHHSLTHVQPMAGLILSGAAMIGSGVALILGLGLFHNEITLADAMVRLGTVLALSGVGLCLYGGLRRKGRSIEEAYRLGYDLGFENGFQSHVAELVERMEIEDDPAKRRRLLTAQRRREHPAMVDLDNGGGK